MTSSRNRRWGDDGALPTDEEACSRLLDAAERCIVRRGNTQIRMAEVADEAGVVRSTVYRYYATRDELLLGVVLRRVATASARWMSALTNPQDAASSIRELVLMPVKAVEDGDAVNDALYASESTALAPVLELGAEAVADIVAAQVGPLFRQWQADGQIYPDLNLRETVQWMSATTSFLLTTNWRQRPAAAKRRFVDRYVIRALVPQSK